MDYTEVVNGRTPTKEDVDSLIAAFGVPEEGREITRQQVADALHIGVDNKRNRITKAITIAVGTDSKRLSSESVKVQNDMRKSMANAKLALAKGLTE